MKSPSEMMNNDRLKVPPKLLTNIQVLTMTSIASASLNTQEQKQPTNNKRSPRVIMDKKLMSIQHGQKTEAQVKSS
jgi:hypothetical protein